MAKTERKTDHGPDELYALRHSTAHVMAGAVLELFPEAKFGFGPAIENGFYYDCDLPRPLTPEDLTKLEERMRAAVKDDGPVEQSSMVIPAAREFFAARRQGVKVDQIGRLEETVAERGTAVPGPAEAAVPAAPAAGPIAPAIPPADTIRLATSRLDALLLQAEDLLVPKLAGGERVREIRALVEALARLRKVLPRRPSVHSATNGPNPEVEATLRGVEALAKELLRHLVADDRAITRVVDGLQEELRRLRLTSAATVLDPFPRMVREMARERGKTVEWVAHGAELEVDRRVLEAVKDPLIHLARNAVDHGIQPPEVRRQAGKAPGGRIEVRIRSLEGGRIEIRVEDDGRGIDPAQVRAAAVRARLLNAEEAEHLPDEAALDLIFRSGLSTSPIITDLSGHGLGLAIVKERVEHLGGQVTLETRAGAETMVRMILPASITTFRGLLVRAGGQPFLLPAEAVERALRIAPGALEHVEGREATRWNGQALFVASLSGVLGLPERDGQVRDGGQTPCVIVRSGEDRAAFLVEEVLGDREVLVKQFRPPLVRVRNVSGAGLLGTGQVVLILRPADLLRALREAPRAPAPGPAEQEPGRRPTILVVDDSITTRTMERNLLEAAGYEVRVAADGVEAWTALKTEGFDLVVSDVDMPRMDGFELTARIRADQKLAELPVILVTALEAREDKERGIEVGANAYVIKSSFDQSNLLEIIRRLV